MELNIDIAPSHHYIKWFNLGSINRITFANHDSSRLAIASVDGTISICKTWPPGEQFRVMCTFNHKNNQNGITDLAWSMTNEFLASTCLDGSICVWNVNKEKLQRSYSNTTLSTEPMYACTFHPVNNNLLVCGGALGEVRVIWLFTLLW